MSRGGRQKFGIEFIDLDQARHVWSKLPLGSTVPVCVVMLPTSISVIAKPGVSRLHRVYDTELAGVYDMTIPLKDFLADVRFAAEILMKRSRKLVA